MYPSLYYDLEFQRDAANHVMIAALRLARREANRARLYPNDYVTAYVRGFVDGQLMLAASILPADPIVATAAKNEARFLLGTGYAGRPAS